MALPPPAVFSMSSGSGKPPSFCLVGEGLAPVVDADGRVVLGQDVPAVHDQAEGADRRGRRGVRGEQLAAGTRMRLFVVATLSMYGAWTTTMTSAASRSAWSGRGLGVLVALRIGQEHLDAVGVHLGRAGQRTAVQEFVVVGQTRADVDTDRVNRHGCRP